MKQSLMYMVFSLVCLGTCVSCSGSSAGAPSAADLLHHRYVLTHVDGEEFTGLPDPRIPEISFNENMHISGQMCNRFSGQGELSADGVLTVKQMVSTKMLCVNPKLNKLESTISKMLMDGAQLTLSGENLIVRQGENELIYVRKDLVK